MTLLQLFDKAPALTAREAVVVASGEIDILTAGRLREQLGMAMGAPATVVVLDTSAVTFIDCSGLREIAAAQARLEASGRGLRLRRPSPAVVRLLEWSGNAGSYVIDDTQPVPTAG